MQQQQLSGKGVQGSEQLEAECVVTPQQQSLWLNKITGYWIGCLVTAQNVCLLRQRWAWSRRSM